MFQFLLLIVDIDIIFQCLISDHIVPIFFHSIFKTYHCVFKANNRTEQMFFFPGSEISEIQICQVSEFLQGKTPLLAAPQGKIFKTGVYYLNIYQFHFTKCKTLFILQTIYINRISFLVSFSKMWEIRERNLAKTTPKTKCRNLGCPVNVKCSTVMQKMLHPTNDSI